MRKQSAAKPKHKTNKNQHEKVQGVSKIPRWNGVKPTQSNTPTLSSLQSNSHPSQVSQVFVIRSRTAHSIFQEHCPFLELHQRPLLVRFLLMSSSGSGAYPRFSPVPSTLFLTVVEPFLWMVSWPGLHVFVVFCLMYCINLWWWPQRLLSPVFSWLKGDPPGTYPSSCQQKKHKAFLTVVEPFYGWFLGLDSMFLLLFAWCRWNMSLRCSWILKTTKVIA